LEDYGFKINPYYPCVATNLSSIYGDKLSVKRGKVHDYLGMDLDYSERGSVKVSMIKYTVKVLRGFPENVTGNVMSPAQVHLFKLRDESNPNYEPLTEVLARSFHAAEHAKTSRPHWCFSL